MRPSLREVLCLIAGGGFGIIVFDRLLMGVGRPRSMVTGLTAILRFWLRVNGSFETHLKAS